jgi:excisionase family DNA binding protein
MSDMVLIPLPGVGTLALTLEQYREALTTGAEFGAASRTSASPMDDALLDSGQAAARLGVTPRWLEDMARAGIVPHHKFGRFIRFSVREVAAHFRVKGATPPTDSQSVTAFRRQLHQ